MCIPQEKGLYAREDAHNPRGSKPGLDSELSQEWRLHVAARRSIAARGRHRGALQGTRSTPKRAAARALAPRSALRTGCRQAARAALRSAGAGSALQLKRQTKSFSERELTFEKLLDLSGEGRKQRGKVALVAAL